MHKAMVVVINRLGLHTRVCAQIVDCAARFSAQITLQYQQQQVDAKRIMEVMSLGAAFGAIVEIAAEGSDAERAISVLVDLFRQGFNESAGETGEL